MGVDILTKNNLAGSITHSEEYNTRILLKKKISSMFVFDSKER